MRQESVSAIRLSNHSIRIMLELLEEEGIDPRPVIADAELNEADLQDPIGKVSGPEEIRFQQAFVAATRHLSGIWLRAGLRYRAMCFGPLGIAMLTSRTVGDAVRILSTFQDLTFSLMHYGTMEQDGRVIGIIADDSFVPADLREFALERALGSVHRFLHDIRQGPVRLERVESSLNRPSGWMDSDRLFGIPIDFNCARTSWTFANGEADLPLPLANTLVEETYELVCVKLVEEAVRRDDLVSKLYALLEASAHGYPIAANAANMLAVSERTLHRRLEARNLTYGMVVDQLRKQRAQHMLRNSPSSVEDIADILGFAETASFSRAFKRWTGISPLAFRKGQSRQLGIGLAE